jgi:hypothetical protein
VQKRERRDEGPASEASSQPETRNEAQEAERT